MSKRSMTLAEIAEAFSRCETNATMSSLRAVLAIGREGIDSRARAKRLRNIALVGAGVALLTLAASPFVPPHLAGLRLGIQIVAGVLTLAAALRVWSLRSRIDLMIREEAEIRRMILASARKIALTKGFFAQPLPPDQRAMLKASCRHEDVDEEIQALLTVH